MQGLTHPVHMVASAYSIELDLQLEDAVLPNCLAVTLRDQERTGIQKSGRTYLSFDIDLSEAGLSAANFLRMFLAGCAIGKMEGLRFGQYLLHALLRDCALESLWGDIQKLRGKRPLRLELVLPSDEKQRQLTLPRSKSAQWGPDGYDLADLPFEVLADADGFLFRRYGNSLVRTLRGLERRSYTLKADDNALLAWANPPDTQNLGDTVGLFETSCQEAIRKLGLKSLRVCQRASRESLLEALAAKPALLLLLAHGS